jgi:hypothetical protein
MTSILSSSQKASVETELDLVLGVAREHGRIDLATRIAAARDRVSRPETIIAVVGEFKQGKSSVVNGLLGENLCPVDDDIATAVLTVIHHGEPAVTIWRQTEEGLKGEAVGSDQLEAFTTEQSSPAERAGIALAEIRLPNPLLARGVALVDTPGVGGLSAGYAGLTLGYLHTADALLFVSDASAPLSGAELDFLKLSAEQCEKIILVLSKIDLFPEWRRIAEINREVLSVNGIAATVCPLSSALRSEAFSRMDAELNNESGYPELLNIIGESVLDPSRELAASRARIEALFVVDQLLAEITPELAALDDPDLAAGTIEALKSEQERLERLRAGSARWQILLNDQFGDLVADTDHRFRQRIRQISRQTDESIENGDPTEIWDDVIALLRDLVASASSGVIRELEAGSDIVGTRIVDLLKEESLAIDAALGRARPVDVSRLWSAAPPPQQALTEKAGMGWASLRGAQGGILVFGMLGSLAGIALSTGMMLGVGAIFGGKQIFEERRKQVTQRRQKARAAIRQFLDDVQFEVGKSTREVSRELQRQLRDHFAERIAESVRTCAAAAENLQRSAQQDESTRKQRTAELRQAIDALSAAQERLAGLPVGAL